MDASLSGKNIKKCIWELKKRKKVSFSAARVISFHQAFLPAEWNSGPPSLGDGAFFH